MILNELKNKGLHKEIKIIATKSSGPGGQHVNKVSTRIELRFNINSSDILNAHEKQRILQILGKQVNQNGEIIIVSQQYRSQLRNKEDAINKLYTLIHKALIIPKKRIPTRPSAHAVRKRLDAKRMQSLKKRSRNRNFEE